LACFAAVVSPYGVGVSVDDLPHQPKKQQLPVHGRVLAIREIAYVNSRGPLSADVGGSFAMSQLPLAKKTSRTTQPENWRAKKSRQAASTKFFASNV
jgi:hypothetical protein